MSRSKRAAQFAMFDALKGLKQAIAAKEKIAEPRRELGEDRIAELNETITGLQRGQMVRRSDLRQRPIPCRRTIGR